MTFSLKPLTPALALLGALSANAQIPAMGNLLGSANLGAAPLGGALPAELPIDLLGGGANPLAELMESAGTLGELGGSLDGLLFAAEIFLPAFQDVPKLVPTSLDISLAQGFIPVLETLFFEPVNLPNFILGGGTLVSPGLSNIPAIPVLSTPLSGPAEIADLFPAGAVPTDFVQPDVVLSLLLGQLSAGSALLPPLGLPM